jgi:hypothetical protein
MFPKIREIHRRFPDDDQDATDSTPGWALPRSGDGNWRGFLLPSAA